MQWNEGMMLGKRSIIDGCAADSFPQLQRRRMCAQALHVPRCNVFFVFLELKMIACTCVGIRVLAVEAHELVK